MKPADAARRTFLFLQGPASPLFARIADHLREAWPSLRASEPVPGRLDILAPQRCRQLSRGTSTAGRPSYHRYWIGKV